MILMRMELPPKNEYEKNVRTLEAAKENFATLGIFNKEFLESLQFTLADDVRAEHGEFRSYALLPDGSVRAIEQAREDLTKDVPILSERLVERLSRWDVPMNDRHATNMLWLENPGFNRLYSFEACAAHEIAHTQSFRFITPDNNEKFTSPQYDSEKLSEVLSKILAHSSISRAIDFSRFRNTFAEWTEIYAILHQREYLRRADPKNEELLREWDGAIEETAGTIRARLDELNHKTGRAMTEDMIYEENHTLSLLCAGLLEKEIPDFRKRIELLESCKRPEHE